MKRITGFAVSAMLAFTVNATDAQVSAHNNYNANKAKTAQAKAAQAKAAQAKTAQTKTAQTKAAQAKAATADAISSKSTHKDASQQTLEHKTSVKTAKHSVQADKEAQAVVDDAQDHKADSRS